MGTSSYVDAVIMGRHLIIKEPELEHIEELAETMRQADKDEIRRYSGNEPIVDLDCALTHSSYARVALVDGQVLAVWGLVTDSRAPGVGSPWCFTSDLADSYRRVFTTFSKFYVEEMLKRCPVLCVDVDALHGKAVRWLRFLGFTLTPIDHNGHKFFRASQWCQTLPERPVGGGAECATQ